MTKSVWSGMCAAIACTVTIAAAQTTPPPSSQTPSSSAADKVTLTGCIERSSASSSPTGTSGTAGASSASSETKFILNTAPSSSSTAGTSGTASASAKSYRLDADDSQLTPHVGHKVEITGTVQGGASASSATSTGSTTNAPKLKVDSVKMIASSCQ